MGLTYRRLTKDNTFSCRLSILRVRLILQKVSMNPVFDPLRLASVAMDIAVVNQAAPADIARRQATRLRKMLALAQRSSVVYRERLKGKSLHRGESDLLSGIPVVTREELMQRFDDWVTDPRLKLDELRAFTADPTRIGEPYLGRYVVWESSGTGGQPGMFVQNGEAMAVYDALEALRRSAPRPLARWMDPLCLSERTAFVGATSGHFASYVTLERLRRLNPWMAQTTRSFSILQSTNALVSSLNAFNPTVIATYPTAAALLADEAEKGNLQVNLREIWTGGECLSPTVRERLKQVMGCTVRNSYGASEFLALGWECAEGHLHVNADWAILEPVDERHRPVPPGELSCTVLLTNLANTVQPLIRYDLGDQVTLQTERCMCGSPLPVIEVQGRQDEPLVVTGDHGQLVTLLPLALTTVLEEQANVFDFQLRQTGDHTLVLRLGLDGVAAEEAMARCRSVLHSFAASQGLGALRVVGELGQPIPRGRSGKALRVIGRSL